MVQRRTIKGLASILLLAVVFRSVRFDSLAAVVKTVSIPAVVGICLGYLAGQCLSALKWCLIANGSGLRASKRHAIRAYLTGMFFNLLGIGTVGGDVVRGVLIGSSAMQRATGIASVVADRAHGLAVLATIGTVASAIFGIEVLAAGQHVQAYLVAGLVGLGALIVAFWFWAPSLVRLAVPTKGGLHQKIEQLLEAFPRDPKLLVTITVLSIAFHGSQIALHYCIAEVLSIHISLPVLLVVVPFINIVSSLPISWQGLGVRENAYRFFFVPAICSPEQAVAFGAIWLLAVTVSSLVGGLVAMATGGIAEARLLTAAPAPAPPPSGVCHCRP
jgi:uncharacterized membrane protein YbhN (UPF0104 family)